MRLSKHLIKIGFLLVLPVASCTDESEPLLPEVDTDVAESVSPAYDPEEMDVTRPDTPVMPHAQFETVVFEKSSSYLNPQAQESLRNLIGRLDEGEPVLLTVRMRDEDAIDATPPTDQFKALTPERVTAVTKFLEQQGVTVAQVAIDEAGEVASIGEDTAMARDPNGTPEDAQVVVVTLTTRDEPEPSDTIPH